MTVMRLCGAGPYCIGAVLLACGEILLGAQPELLLGPEKLRTLAVHLPQFEEARASGRCPVIRTFLGVGEALGRAVLELEVGCPSDPSGGGSGLIGRFAIDRYTASIVNMLSGEEVFDGGLERTKKEVLPALAKSLLTLEEASCLARIAAEQIQPEGFRLAESSQLGGKLSLFPLYVASYVTVGELAPAQTTKFLRVDRSTGGVTDSGIDKDVRVEVLALTANAMRESREPLHLELQEAVKIAQSTPKMKEMLGDGCSMLALSSTPDAGRDEVNVFRSFDKCISRQSNHVVAVIDLVTGMISDPKTGADMRDEAARAIAAVLVANAKEKRGRLIRFMSEACSGFRNKK